MPLWSRAECVQFFHRPILPSFFFFSFFAKTHRHGKTATFDAQPATRLYTTRSQNAINWYFNWKTLFDFVVVITTYMHYACVSVCRETLRTGFGTFMWCTHIAATQLNWHNTLYVSELIMHSVHLCKSKTKRNYVFGMEFITHDDT